MRKSRWVVLLLLLVAAAEVLAQGFRVSDIRVEGLQRIPANPILDIGDMQAALGDRYVYRLDKAQALDSSAQMFLIIQALISTYGLMSLGVVGLLVYTLVMTNVQEQRREMAILRILGSQRNLLFGTVVVEVLVIGVVGVGLGILLGQAITACGVVPLIEHLMSQEGQATALKPAVSLSGILPAVRSHEGSHPRPATRRLDGNDAPCTHY